MAMNERLNQLGQAARRLNEGSDQLNGLISAIDKALSSNMTKDTVERAVKRGSGADGADMQEVRYEGYGPSGVALIIDCMSDNSQRT